MKPNKKKSDNVPTHWSTLRRFLNDSFLDSEGYKESVKKGLPFYTKNELKELKKLYHNGITWKQIDEELANKGVIFKQATFRKYIQERKIPAARGYRITDTGREAIYPKDTIEHINFLQYFYRIAHNKEINKLIENFSEISVTAKDAIEDQLESLNLREGVFMFLRDASTDGDDIEQTIRDVLNQDQELMKKAIEGLYEIYDGFKSSFEKWSKMLQESSISVVEKNDEEEKND
jgi:hypothetical protein